MDHLRDLDAEEALLGGGIASYDTLSTMVERMTPDWFGFTEHGLIFRAMQSIYEQSRDIDLKQLGDRMTRTHTLREAGGVAKLAHLESCACPPSKMEYHLGRVEEFWRRRQLLALSGSISQRVNDEGEDLTGLMNDAEEAFYSLRGDTVAGALGIESLLQDVYEEARENEKLEDPLLGVTTGLKDVDEYTSGLQRQDLIVLAARPSMGKTALALKMARAAAASKSVLLFSLEMSSRALVTRMVSQMTRIDGRRIRRGRLSETEWQSVAKSMGALSTLNLHIDDRSSTSPTAARLKTQKLQRQQPVGLVVIDYLQLMTLPGKNNSRVDEVTKISQGCKALAKDCDVPVLALSQLSRASETASRRPQLSDLRDSGSIEQDADVVMFLYHPYKQKEEDAEQGKCECIFGKQRNGPTGTVPLFWDEPYARFDNWIYGPV
jgi:replicative DNA helicase